MTYDERAVQQELSAWIRGDFEFGTTFSYRLPGASSQFAVGTPIPSPAAVKLALVAAAIHEAGDVSYGERVFSIVRDCPVYFGLPERLTRFRAFIKRLKPSKEGEFLESTGSRDYFLFASPLEVYVRASRDDAGIVENLLHRIRRFGTTDSLCWCTTVERQSPDPRRCAVPLNDVVDHLHEETRTLVSLLDLSPAATFQQVDPFRQVRQQGNPFVRVPYALPLQVESTGTNWTILVRREA